MKLNFSTLNSSSKKINGYNISGHCGKFLWIRIALLEKLLGKIVEDLQNNARLEDFDILKAHYHPECIVGISHLVENCHLGNNSQSEHCMQQMNWNHLHRRFLLCNSLKFLSH